MLQEIAQTRVERGEGIPFADPFAIRRVGHHDAAGRGGVEIENVADVHLDRVFETGMGEILAAARDRIGITIRAPDRQSPDAAATCGGLDAQPLPERGVEIAQFGEAEALCRA